MTAAEVLAVLREDGGDTLLPVYVQPRASRSRLVGLHDGYVKVAVAAPPVDGAANKALTRAIARWLGCARRDVHIERGATGRRKRVRITGVPPERVAHLITSA